MKHRGEANSPRIVFERIVRIAPKDSRSLVHRACDLCISAAAEDRTGARVRVEEGEIVVCKIDSAFFIVSFPQLLGAGKEKGKFRLSYRPIRSCQREKAEIEHRPDAWKELLAVREIEEAGQSLFREQRVEKYLCRIVRSDTSRDDHASASCGGYEFAAEFGEDGVGVDVAAAGEGEALALAGEEGGGFGIAAGALEIVG